MKPPFYSNALGGIELLVHPDAKEDTLAIIKKLDKKNGDLRVVWNKKALSYLVDNLELNF